MSLILDFSQLEVGQSVAGLVYIQEHGKHDGVSKAPLYGNFVKKAQSIRFKVWNSTNAPLIELFNQYDLSGRIASILGDVTEYRGTKEINLTRIEIIHEDKVPEFLPHFIRTADHNALGQELWGMLQTEMNEKHAAFAVEYFQSDEGANWRGFLTTWAGKVLHDAQVGGLINHTVKMMRIAKQLLANDERLKDMYSLLQLSLLYHDIGKLRELGDGGQYTKTSFITHRSLGIEMMVEKKAMCLKYLTEHEYYLLLSVIQGHHGDFGDKPTSVLAQWIHYIDQLDAKFTMYLDMIEGEKTVEYNHNVCIQVPFEGSKLVL